MSRGPDLARCGGRILSLLKIRPGRVGGGEAAPGSAGILAGAMRLDKHEHAGKDAGAPRSSDNSDELPPVRLSAQTALAHLS